LRRAENFDIRSDEIEKEERRRVEVEAQEAAGVDPGYAEAWIEGGDYVGDQYDI